MDYDLSVSVAFIGTIEYKYINFLPSIYTNHEWYFLLKMGVEVFLHLD